MSQLNNYDLIIVGGGPTGLVCGIEAKKRDLSYLIIEKGKLVNSIYNFPSNMTFFSTSKNLEVGHIPFVSHNEKPTRFEALEYYRRLSSNFELNINYDERVEDIIKINKTFKVETLKANYTATNVIVATGFYDNYRPLNIPGENLTKVKHYYDDPHPYVDRQVLIVGARNSACDVALETWRHGAEVTMAIRSDSIHERVKYWIRPNIINRIREGSIKAYFKTCLIEIKPHSVVLATREGNKEIPNDYVLAMTGYKPDYPLLQKFGISIDHESLEKKPICHPETLESTIEGLYLAGVIITGLHTSGLFIENTRHHGQMILDDIVKKQDL